MKTAWYVDDDQEMIQAVTLMMSLLDFEVRPFLHAGAASKAFTSGRPDLLILDINMPGVSGIDMLEFIRSRTEFIDLPIIMLSSEYTDAQVDESLAKGADAFVMKPVTLEELEEAIQKAFRIRGVD
jgi:two-component system alkaline phosphatase synthesis response regulator PhoP